MSHKIATNMNLEPRPSSAVPQNSVYKLTQKRKTVKQHVAVRGSSDKWVEWKVSHWHWKEMNKIKDDKPVINIQSEEYKIGRA